MVVFCGINKQIIIIDISVKRCFKYVNTSGDTEIRANCTSFFLHTELLNIQWQSVLINRCVRWICWEVPLCSVKCTALPVSVNLVWIRSLYWGFKINQLWSIAETYHCNKSARDQSVFLLTTIRSFKLAISLVYTHSIFGLQNCNKRVVICYSGFDCSGVDAGWCAYWASFDFDFSVSVFFRLVTQPVRWHLFHCMLQNQINKYHLTISVQWILSPPRGSNQTGVSVS